MKCDKKFQQKRPKQKNILIHYDYPIRKTRCYCRHRFRVYIVLILSPLSGVHEWAYIRWCVSIALLVVSGGFSTHLKGNGKCTIHEIRFLLWDIEAFIACNHGKIPKLIKYRTSIQIVIIHIHLEFISVIQYLWKKFHLIIKLNLSPNQQYFIYAKISLSTPAFK